MKIRRSRIVLAVITLGGIGLASFLTTRAGAVGEVKNYAAGLLGSNEVAPGDPDATGSGTATINSSTNEFCWNLQATGIATIVKTHFHNGLAGANGPVKIDFDGAMSGCKTVDAALIADVIAKPTTYYFNIHTTDFPDGAVRGQLDVAAVGPLTMSALPSPVRVYDSRQPANKKLEAKETRNVALVQGRDAAGVAHAGVPIGAVAAQVVITVTQTNGAGYLNAHASGSPVPEASVINWFAANSDLATSAMVPVDLTGRIALTAGPTSSTHFIVDVVGYYVRVPQS
jgi:hypothetical protein